jgi:uncharacterized protein YndB with AHSA1/START domain
MNESFTAHVETVVNRPVAEVWKALTDPALVKQYFFGVDLITDWQPGSPITYKGIWKDQPFEDKGSVIRVEPNRLLETNYWSHFSGKPDSPENYQIVRYELVSEDDVITSLGVTQEGLDSEEAVATAENNWRQVLEGLKKLLES